MPETHEEGRWALLCLLTLAMIVSFADRTVLALLVQPIKEDIGLSDGAIGVLTGFAFAAFYAVAGLAIARMADRNHGRTIVIGSLVIWSIMTALCGFAQNFWQLLLARFGVGAGEAGIVPTAQTMIAHSFPTERRSTVMAILMAGGPLGIILAFLVTGQLEAQIGWRMTFVVMGIPGLLLAVAFLPFKFPSNRRTVAHLMTDRSSFFAALRDILRIRRFGWTVTIIVTLSLLTFGQAQWLPAYLERSFAVPRAQIGPMLALTQGVGMLAGTLCGGPLFDRLAVQKPSQQASFVSITCLFGLPFLLAIYIVPDVRSATILAGVAAVIFALPSGRLWATVQESVPSDKRAVSTALAMMLASLLGQGIGPVVIGLLSDLLLPYAHDRSLQWALLIVLTMGSSCMIVAAAQSIRSARDQAVTF